MKIKLKQLVKTLLILSAIFLLSNVNSAEKIEVDENFSIHLNFGIEFYQNGNIAEAFTEFDNLILLEPSSSIGHLWKAKCLIRNKDMEKAKTELEFARALEPDNKEVKDLLAQNFSLVEKKNSVSADYLTEKVELPQNLPEVKEFQEEKQEIFEEEPEKLTEEDLKENCEKNRRKIDEAIFSYNLDHSDEMSGKNFSMDKLVENNYLESYLRCPSKGNYRYEASDMTIYCSVHQKK